MGISQSRLNMWRAVIAVVHADSVVKPHEIHFILESIKELPLSPEQREILVKDFQIPHNIELSFPKITNPTDKEDFFYFARSVAWSDGHLDEREEKLLKRAHFLCMLPAGLLADNISEIYLDRKSPNNSFSSVVQRLVGARGA